MNSIARLIFAAFGIPAWELGLESEPWPGSVWVGVIWWKGEDDE